MAKRERVMKVEINPATLCVTWSFPGSDLQPIVLSMEKVHADNVTYAALHGMNQRCSDNAAGAEGAEAKRAAVLEMVEWYESGTDQWERPRVGGGGFKFDAGLVAHALANIKTNGDIDRANRAIDALAAKRNVTRDDAAKLFAADADIAAEMTRIRASKRPAAVDADSLLGEI